MVLVRLRNCTRFQVPYKQPIGFALTASIFPISQVRVERHYNGVAHIVERLWQGFEVDFLTRGVKDEQCVGQNRRTSEAIWLSAWAGRLSFCSRTSGVAQRWRISRVHVGACVVFINSAGMMRLSYARRVLKAFD